MVKRFSRAGMIPPPEKEVEEGLWVAVVREVIVREVPGRWRFRLKEFFFCVLLFVVGIVVERRGSGCCCCCCWFGIGVDGPTEVFSAGKGEKREGVWFRGVCCGGLGLLFSCCDKAGEWCTAEGRVTTMGSMLSSSMVLSFLSDLGGKVSSSSMLISFPSASVNPFCWEKGEVKRMPWALGLSGQSLVERTDVCEKTKRSETQAHRCGSD